MLSVGKFFLMSLNVYKKEEGIKKSLPHYLSYRNSYIKLWDKSKEVCMTII